jgi:hypothetical protein
MKGNIDQGICRMEGGWSHIPRCEGSKSWRDELLEKSLQLWTQNSGLEKIKYICPKTGLYLKKKKEMENVGENERY